jgi:acyl-CoA dehydrogenase
MVSFELTEEQQALQEMTARFVREEIIPVAAHHDETGEYPTEIGRKAFALGLVNITVPEEYGGGGLGSFEEVLITEEICYGCTGIAISLTVNNLATVPLVLGGSEELKREYLGRLTESYATASYCLSEPDAGSDAAGISTRAEKKGDTYVLNGNKAWVSGGAHASWFVIFASTDPSQGRRGISAFIVPADAAGLIIGKKENMMGQRASSTVFLTLEDVEIPVGHRLGEEGEGFKLAMRTFDRTRPGIAAAAVGISRRALDESLRYAQERKAFGQPIAQFQAIQFMLADMYKDMVATRLLAWQSAWKIDRGERNTLECSVAKAFGADAAMRITTDAVQIFGGYGYSKEYPVEKLMRDAKVLQIYEGTSQIQRLIIARHLLGD